MEGGVGGDHDNGGAYGTCFCQAWLSVASSSKLASLPAHTSHLAHVAAERHPSMTKPRPSTCPQLRAEGVSICLEDVGLAPEATEQTSAHSPAWKQIFPDLDTMTPSSSPTSGASLGCCLGGRTGEGAGWRRRWHRGAGFKGKHVQN